MKKYRSECTEIADEEGIMRKFKQGVLTHYTPYYKAEVVDAELAKKDAEIAKLKRILAIAFDMIPNPPETRAHDELIALIVKALDD